MKLKELEQKNKKLLVVNKNFNKLKNTIDIMSQISIKTHPLKKLLNISI